MMRVQGFWFGGFLFEMLFFTVFKYNCNDESFMTRDFFLPYYSTDQLSSTLSTSKILLNSKNSFIQVGRLPYLISIRLFRL